MRGGAREPKGREDASSTKTEEATATFWPNHANTATSGTPTATKAG